MTTLEKLGILGIRSFSPESLEVLAFEKPLTLIVGHNGAGKTTVVECLKMAATGELPPNSGKGQNFVHNPKSNNYSEVKGQIRLVFKTISQRKILANRSFQLSTTKDRKGKIKTTYKALESVLQVKDTDGSTRSINKKCADMDYQVPLLMGVSKAILENVVFCHQEESNWPLMEMAKLKKKFDDLFGATRYSKALDAINNLRKEHQKIGREKLHQLELLKSVLEQATVVQDKIKKAEEKDKIYCSEIELLKDRLADYKTELCSVKEALEAANAVEREIGVKREIIKRLENEIEALGNDKTDKLVEPLEKLVCSRNELESSIKEQRQMLTLTEKESSHLEVTLRDLTQRLNDIQQQSSEVLRAKEIRELNLQRKARLINEINTSESLKTSINQTADYEFIITMLQDLKEEKMNELKNKKAEAEQKIELSLVALKNQETAQTETLNEVVRITSAVETLQNELQTITSTIESGEDIKKNLISITKELQNIKDIGQNNELEELSKVLEGELFNLRKQQAALRQHLENASLNFELVETANKTKHELYLLDQRIQEQRKIYLTKFDNTNKLIGAHPILKASVKQDIIDSQNFNIEKFCSIMKSLQEDFSKLRIKKSFQETKKGSLTGRITLLTEEIKSLKKEKFEIEQQFKKVDVDLDTYNTVLLQQKEEAENKTKELLVAKNASTLYHNYLQHSISKNKCAFCTRPFNTANELETLKNHLSSRITRLPQTIERNEKEAGIAEERLTQLLNLGEMAHSNKRVEEMLLKKEEALEKLHADFSTVEKDLVSSEEDVKQATVLNGLLVDIQNQLEQLESLSNGTKKLQERYDDLHMQRLADTVHEAEDDNDDGTTENVKTTIQMTNEKLRLVNQSVEDKEKEIADMSSRRLKFSNDIAQLTATKLHCEERLRVIDTMKQQAKEKGAQIKHLQSELVAIRSKSTKSQKDTKEHRDELHAIQVLTTEQQRQFFHDINFLNRLLQEFKDLETPMRNAIKCIEEFGGATDPSTPLKKEVDLTMKKLHDRRQKAAEIRENVEKDCLHLKQFEQNIIRRQKENTISQSQFQINELLQKHGCQDPMVLNNSLDSLTEETNKLSNQMSLKNGERNANNEWLDQHKAELNAPKFKDLQRRYLDAILETDTELMVIRDLQKYHGALDKALMKYHTVKMQEINRSIRDYWHTMYRGEDIDYIMIRSDTDEEIQFASTGQRSYNYRVTMIKDGIEMEMRGRCSAGQKVLASIVIRLALAESFCVNCGILALDEPTTNLDRNNMDGLAKALADLIESRRNCTNFQLILITHDEDFVRMLSRHQPYDSFFQIKKNQDGYSTIRRADIRTF